MTHSSETSEDRHIMFLDTIISFSHSEKKIPFLDLFTTSKQHYTHTGLVASLCSNLNHLSDQSNLPESP